eukprot:TRINITY_DN1477_c0_g1_i1.p1 TRINITY_DN1477_c0_g1~~TRINITY_DN1477_c0_g1_i1.p1  ORF type:complete len:1004 (+),score=192.45 TRINITY_DN1477_c0_g1_i1:187-3198(+)
MYSRTYTLVCAAFVVLFALACSSYETPSAFSQMVLHLDQLQTPGGGFMLRPKEKPSLEATSHALFLSSLFGLKKKINSNAVPLYLASLENGDSGYGQSTGSASDLASVRHAVLCYQRLGLPIPNSANIAAFIKSLLDPETRLFASRAGEAGNLKATAIAFQTLEMLGETQRGWVQETYESLKSYLNSHFKPASGNYHFVFPEEKELTVVSANYYGIVLGSFVGFPFSNLPKWASSIASWQNKNDGTFSGQGLEATAHAVSSLRLLQQLQKENFVSFVDLIDTDKLAQSVQRIPEDLRSAANAHLAIALTNKFVDNFEVTTNYEVLRGSAADKLVVQGTQLRPFLSVKTFGGVAHAGLDVEAQISHGDASPTTSKLHWAESEQYVSNELFDTANRLGDLNFTYVIRCFVAGVGELSFVKVDDKQVGYGIVVDADAKLEVTGKEFAEGDAVPIGTDFSFAVTLQNHTQDNLLSGEFHVIFTVIDSSNVPIHSESVDRRVSTAPVKFHYSLKSSKIPGGVIGFRFEVSNDKGVHTSKTVTYQLSLPMVATAISFDGSDSANYKIGQTVRVSIEPATFPDLHTVYGYAATDINGKPTGPRRSFYMDVSSVNGALLRSVAGTPSNIDNGNTRYSFAVPVTPTLDALGTNVVSFRYVPANGDDVVLSNYDSSNSELYEDAAALNYTVKSDLYMVDVQEKPTAQDYYYGNEISYRFGLKDAVTGQRVTKGNTDNANVYLSLQHQDEDKTTRSFASTNEPATEVVGADGKSSFYIKWAINPNAVQGQGYLALSAQDADGNRAPLYVEGSKSTPVRYDVNIGGNITVHSETYSTSDVAYEQTAFVAQFTLSCQDKQLRNAQLQCSVHPAGASASSPALVELLPVATSRFGAYAVSFTLPHAEVPSGEYVFRCYREVDRRRAAEAKELLEKKRRIAEELKQFGEHSSSSSSSSTDSAGAGAVGTALEPLFSISLRHSAPYTGRLPVRTEYLALALFGAVFFYASYQKKLYVTK